jgi:hypothetical protein
VPADRSALPEPSREVRLVLGAVLVVLSAVVIATSGESVAVRLLLAIVTLDVAYRLVAGRRGTGYPPPDR